MAIRGQGIEGGWIASLAAGRPPRFREPVRLRPGNRVQLGLVQRSRGPWGARDANCFGLGSESDAKPKQFARTAPARAIRPILPRCPPAKCGEPSMETGPATAYPAHAPRCPAAKCDEPSMETGPATAPSGPSSLGAWPRKAASPAWKLGPPRRDPAHPPSVPGREKRRAQHGNWARHERIRPVLPRRPAAQHRDHGTDEARRGRPTRPARSPPPRSPPRARRARSRPQARALPCPADPRVPRSRRPRPGCAR